MCLTDLVETKTKIYALIWMLCVIQQPPKEETNLRHSFPLNDEINELRDRLEKLKAKNVDAIPTTTTSPFSAEIQEVLLPVGFRIPTMVT